MVTNKYSGSRPCFVKIFKGFDTAGEPIFEQTCICPECLGRTTPTHPAPQEEEDERDKP